MKTKTTKIFESTHNDVKRLSSSSTEGFTQAQIISRAVHMYAETQGYLHTHSGITTEGDTVVFADDSTVIVNKIVNGEVFFSDGTTTTSNGRELWRIKGIQK